MSSRQRERQRWRGMLRRCENPADPAYRWYGARGIQVCERWHDFENYYADIAKLLGPGGGLSLDRIDNDGDYEPGNVRWASAWQQVANSRTYGRIKNPDLHRGPREVPAVSPGQNRWADAARKRWRLAGHPNYQNQG